MKDGTLGLRRRKGMAVKLEQLKVDKDGNIHSVDSEIKKNKKTADKIINQQPRRERRAQCSTFRTVCSIRWLQSALIPFVTTQASGY